MDRFDHQPSASLLSLLNLLTRLSRLSRLFWLSQLFWQHRQPRPPALIPGYRVRSGQLSGRRW